MMALLLLEIIAVPAERRRGRRNPRVVKRKMSNFPTKARAAPARPGWHEIQHIQIVAPAVPKTPPPAAGPPPLAPASAKRVPRGRPNAAPDACRQSFWLDHVRAWRTSNLTRTAYCQCRDIDPRNFDAWVTRLRHRFRRSVKASGNP